MNLVFNMLKRQLVKLYDERSHLGYHKTLPENSVTKTLMLLIEDLEDRIDRLETWKDESS